MKVLPWRPGAKQGMGGGCSVLTWLCAVSGTYCQQREVEAITEGIEDNEGTVYFTQRQRNNQDPRNLNQPLFFEGHFKVKHRLAK